MRLHCLYVDRMKNTPMSGSLSDFGFPAACSESVACLLYFGCAKKNLIVIGTKLFVSMLSSDSSKTLDRINYLTNILPNRLER